MLRNLSHIPLQLQEESRIRLTLPMCRSDAQRASKLKEVKEKELEMAAFNAEHIEDQGHARSLVNYVRIKTLFCYT